MKDTKRRVEFFSFYDHTGIEAHLKRMAEQGWLLYQIGKFAWHYRRIEPKKLTFSVCYYPKASAFDPGPSDEQETFYDFCQHTGWELAASSAQMQVFYNGRENPVPIDTDPALEVDAIHQSAKRNFLPAQLMLAAVGVMNLAMYLLRLWDDPVATLSSPFILFGLVCWPALLLLLGVDLGTYFLWHRRARRAAEQGEFLSTRSHPVFQKIMLAVVTAAFVWLLASLASGGSPVLAVVMALAAAGAFCVMAVVWGVSAVLKRKKVPADTNRAATLALSIGLSVLVVAMVPVLVFSLDQSLLNWESNPEELPLSLADLLEQPAGDYRQNKMLTQSPLLGVLDVYQYLPPSGRGTKDSRSLDYSVTVVKAPFLYDLCKAHLLAAGDTRENNRIPEGDKSYYVPAAPAPWGAVEAYQIYRQDGGLRNTYLLCYPACIVRIALDWEPSPGQIAVAGEKLGGV